jgi:hypothetical protein
LRLTIGSHAEDGAADYHCATNPNRFQVCFKMKQDIATTTADAGFVEKVIVPITN